VQSEGTFLIGLGGTGIKAGVVNEEGKIIATAKCPTGVERGYGPVIADMAKLSLEAVEKAGVSLDEVKGIGIGIPGIQDPATGLVPFCTNLGWHQVPLVSEMQKYIDDYYHSEDGNEVGNENGI
jgi:glucokinase